jgi:DNA-binding NarL/FixJ family response regulator
MEIIFSQEPDFELKGSFASRIELMNFLRNNRVDVLVLDYLLGDEEIDGLPMIKQLMSNFVAENSAFIHAGKYGDCAHGIKNRRAGACW